MWEEGLRKEVFSHLIAPGLCCCHRGCGAVELLCRELEWQGQWPCWVAGLRGVQSVGGEAASVPLSAFLTFFSPFKVADASSLFLSPSFVHPLLATFLPGSPSVAPGLQFTSGFFSFPPHSPQLHCVITQLSTEMSLCLLSSTAHLTVPLISRPPLP